MILILENHPDKDRLERLLDQLTIQGFTYHFIQGDGVTLLGILGDTSGLDPNQLRGLSFVKGVRTIQEPYPLASRTHHPAPTHITVGKHQIGEGALTVMAGPCSVESPSQMNEVAKQVAWMGAHFLRGGAYKSRTSPYHFQGLREEGIRLLVEAGKQAGIPVITEVLDPHHLSLFQDVDVIQIGARNMQNTELLKELGKVDKPVLLKRSPSSTLEELLMSAEYLLAEGNSQVILCERGITTFEKATRYTLDLSAVAYLKAKTHLPVMVDPSHGTGDGALVSSMALAAVAAGADGLMVEVHPHPEEAFCDGLQSITPETFRKLMRKVNRVREALEDREDE